MVHPPSFFFGKAAISRSLDVVASRLYKRQASHWPARPLHVPRLASEREIAVKWIQLNRERSSWGLAVVRPLG